MTNPSRTFLSLVLTAVGIMLVALAFAATGGSRAVGAPADKPATNVIVDNFPATQAVSGTVSIANPVSATVSISNPSLDVRVTQTTFTTRLLSQQVFLDVVSFIGAFDASNCGRIRVIVHIENGLEDPNILLIARNGEVPGVGTIIDTIHTRTKVYETPLGMTMDLVAGFPPPPFPTPAVVEVYCRSN
jgi:hypothetical protein